MRKNKRLISILCVLIIAAGAAILLYPVFRTTEQKAEQKEAVEEFRQYIEEHDEQRETPKPMNLPENEIKAEKPVFSELWNACVAFNEELPIYQENELNAESIKSPALNLSDYGFTESAFGYLSIPDASIEAPIFLGATMANLDKGAAHLGMTSLPIGGDSNNCVIAGHRTWSGAVTFEGLERLDIGDMVYVTNPWETLCYEVIETKVIAPNDSDEILIQSGRDLLTLFTCTNRAARRFLVICERNTTEGGT